MGRTTEGGEGKRKFFPHAVHTDNTAKIVTFVLAANPGSLLSSGKKRVMMM
jgi:hypothetical protein